MHNDFKVCNQDPLYNSSNERSEDKLILKSYSSSSINVNPTWVHYYLQYHNCISYSKPNEHHDVADIDSLVCASVSSKDVVYSSCPVVDSCHTINSHPLYVCQSKVDTSNNRYGRYAEIPASCHMYGIQTMAIFNWYMHNADSTGTKLVYLYPQMGCSLKGFYWAKSDISNSSWDLSICSNIPSGFLEVHQYCLVMEDSDGSVCQSNAADNNAYANYIQDLHCMKTFRCDYTMYMNRVIDKLCQMQVDGLSREIVSSDFSIQSYDRVDIAAFTFQHDSPQMSTSDTTQPATKHCVNPFTGSDPLLSLDGVVNADSPLLSEHLTPSVDINDPHKTTGYLAHDCTAFEFIGPDRFPLCMDTVDQYVAVAKIIQSSGLPNYKVARIPVSSGLNIPAWEAYLLDYPDKRVIQYLKFGFPLSLDENNNLHNIDISNHVSALQYPDAVQDYLDKEISLGAIIGPVTYVPDKDYHCSPLLTRPKDTHKRRVILNLSHPQGNSVNYHVNKSLFDNSHFTLRFPTIDDIVQEVRNCTEDPCLIKIDVSRAFRNLRVDPKDGLTFGIKWGDNYYIDRALAFGWVHGSASFQLAADAVRFILKQKGFDAFAYIDDFIMVNPKHKAQEAFQTLYDVLQELGLPINPDKCNPPSKLLTCLGIDVNITANTISISEVKIRAIHAECMAIYGKSRISKHTFQSLLGKLLYVHKCVAPARMFVNRILKVFRSNSHKKFISINEEFRKDLARFIRFLPDYNGIVFIDKQKLYGNETLYIDACLTGMGGVWNDKVYSTPIFGIPQKFINIANLEMLNTLIALRVWADQWEHKEVLFCCNNWAVVQVIQTSRTKDEFLTCCLRNIWLIVSKYDIQLRIKHVKGIYNKVADALSRLYSHKLVPEAVTSELKTKYQNYYVHPSYFNLDLTI